MAILPLLTAYQQYIKLLRIQFLIFVGITQEILFIMSIWVIVSQSSVPLKTVLKAEYGISLKFNISVCGILNKQKVNKNFSKEKKHPVFK